METKTTYHLRYRLLNDAKNGLVLQFPLIFLRNYSEYPIFKTYRKLLLNLLKNVTNYPNDLITYTVVSGDNSLS